MLDILDQSCSHAHLWLVSILRGYGLVFFTSDFDIFYEFLNMEFMTLKQVSPTSKFVSIFMMKGY